MEGNITNGLHLEADHICAEVRRAFDAAAVEAERLEHIGAAAVEVALADSFSDAPPEELHRRATLLRGHALSALVAVAGLVAEAGRLEAWAEVRRSDVAAGDPPSD